MTDVPLSPNAGIRYHAFQSSWNRVAYFVLEKDDLDGQHHGNSPYTFLLFLGSTKFPMGPTDSFLASD